MTPRKLPLELEEEILFRVPPLSLARFRTVCKRWNTLFNGERFVKNHLARVRPQFFLHTKSKIYSIGINPDDSLDVHDLSCEILCPEKLYFYRHFHYCDGFLVCIDWSDRIVIWNPWLRQQMKWFFESRRKISTSYGIGYDHCRPDKGYKYLGFDDALDKDGYITPIFSMYEFATNKWKDKSEFLDWDFIMASTALSLNGISYWITRSIVSGDHCFIQSFDFSEERFKPFCRLPCKNNRGDTQTLAVFKRDRFCVLEQCHTTRNIEIWVTENTISSGNGEDVSWIKFMTTSIPDLPELLCRAYHVSQPSYFIDNNDDKRLIVCTSDDNGMPYIYVVNEDKFKKISLDFVVDPWPYHLVYVPSLVPIPSAQVEQRE